MNKNNLIEISSKKPSLINYYLEIFQNKYLIYQITRREFVTAYTQSILGILYHAFVPIVQTIVFNFFLNKIDFNPDDKVPTFLFIFIGLTIWNLFFNNSLRVSNIFLTNRKYLGKLYFYRFSLVISSMIINCTHFLINFIILICIILYFKINLSLGSLTLDYKLLFVPLIVFITAIFSSGIGLIICSLSVRYRDLLFGLNFIFQLLMFVSPVLFSLDTINETLSLIFLLNPITSFLELFRWVFISDYMINLTFIWINISFIFIIFLIGSKMFIQSERKVADFI